MKIYYINQEIVQINWDKDDFMWKNTTNSASVLEIDEIDPVNKSVCIDLMSSNNQADIIGLRKYYISNGELFEREGWEVYIDEDDL